MYVLIPFPPAWLYRYTGLNLECDKYGFFQLPRPCNFNISEYSTPLKVWQLQCTNQKVLSTHVLRPAGIELMHQLAELTQKCGGTINLIDTFIPMDKICAPRACMCMCVCHSVCACMCVYVSLSCHYITVMCHYMSLSHNILID